MQSHLPSSLYSIIRKSQLTETVNNGYSMTGEQCQCRATLCGSTIYTNFSGTTKSGSLALRSATTHLTISTVNRNLFCLRHETSFVSLDITEIVPQGQ